MSTKTQESQSSSFFLGTTECSVGTNGVRVGESMVFPICTGSKDELLKMLAKINESESSSKIYLDVFEVLSANQAISISKDDINLN